MIYAICVLHLLYPLHLQVTEAQSASARDQDWLDHINHILHQKVGLTHLQWYIMLPSFASKVMIKIISK